MYIIIAGCRKVGSNLAIVLSQANHDVVVIDSDPENFDLLGTGFNGLTITGMPIDEDVLRSAGIEKADALAAVSNDDNMNVMIARYAELIIGKLGVTIGGARSMTESSVISVWKSQPTPTNFHSSLSLLNRELA